MSQRALLVLPGAKNLTRTKAYDGAISYQLDEPFPPDETVDFIRSTLRENGWAERQTDLLNPGLSLFEKRGWSRVVIGDETVFSWTGQWEDGQRNVVIYGLRYRVRETDIPVIPSGPLYVDAWFLSRETADALRQYTEKQ